VKPYRVGMSCGLCHVGPNPIYPPADPNNPEWANLSSNVGAQYFWTDRIFYEAADYSSFAFQLFHASRPGSLDTSFVSTDNINNPRTMNAVYGLLPRLLNAKRWGQETLAGGGRNKQAVQRLPERRPAQALFTAPVWTPRVLKDGSDSVGAMGALNRVYLNIGAFSEEWLRHSIRSSAASRSRRSTSRRHAHSAYYAATEAQTSTWRSSSLKTTDPHKLADAPGGAALLIRRAAAHAQDGSPRHARLPLVETARVREHAASRGGLRGSELPELLGQYWAATETPQFRAR
jgi:hypothetical protein